MTSPTSQTGTHSKILVVDDEALCRRVLARRLTHNGYSVSTAADARQALEILQVQNIDLVLTDLEMPNGSGLELVRQAAQLDRNLPCVVMTGYGSTERSVEALRAGAFWYLEKPFDKDFVTLQRLLSQALRYRERNGHGPVKSPERRRPRATGRPEIVGQSTSLRRVIAMAEKVAGSRATVLITGESGTGKELIARTIYASSPRSHQPFIPINCGAIPEELLESELFGHVRGAFTNAHQARDGRFSLADSGTIFLDEIGDMSMNLQVKLLRVLQDGTFEPVGSSTTTRVDVRVIAATNQNLPDAIEQHRFRADLYFRLNVVPIRVPPLRDRKEDIPLLAQHFLERNAENEEKKTPRLTEAALERLVSYSWPGNVRELENMVERLVVLAERDEIDVEDLPGPLYPRGETMTAPRLPEDGLRFQDAVGDFENELLLQALTRTGGNKTRAAQLLGLNRTTFLEMIKKRGLGSRRTDA